MINISTNKTGFTNLSYTMTANPVVPFVKLEGFAAEGFQWDDTEPANTRLGADGLAAINQKPVLFQGTATFLPNANCRNILDRLAQATTPKYGKSLVDYNIILTEINKTTRTRTIYYGGVITQAQAGNSANLDDGQGNKAYRFTFTSREIISM